MSRFLVRSGAVLLPLLAPVAALAQGVSIDHEEIGCIVAGKYPKMNACFAPASLVKKAFVYFRPETVPDWYYVEMRSDAPCFSGVLLRPSKALIDKKLFYYLDVQGGGTGRTPEYAPVVVASEEDCRSKGPVAPLSATGPAAVFPSLPPTGFVVGAGVSPAVVAGGVAAAALVAGGAFLLTNDDGTAATIPATVTTTNPPAPVPPAPVPPVPPPPLAVGCRATPREGEVPLRVDFATFPEGGTGDYDFEWTFGDGADSRNRNPSHTFLTTGVFDSTVRVRSGDQTATCSRSITVTRPPTPPPPASFKLTVSLAGSGTGQVTGPGITCGLGGTDCDEAYPSGTTVTLNATPGSSSTFIGWSGACSGTGPCTVTMTADQAVTAKFDAFPVLTVTKTGTGTGTVTGPGISCGADCTESYAPGTVVTLTALPTGGSTFIGWSGACSGTGTCTVTMTADKAVTAKFELLRTLTLQAGAKSDVDGSVTSSPAGITCAWFPTPPTCSTSALFVNGTTVTLTVSSTVPGFFTLWEDACLLTSVGNTCTVVMDADKNVIVNTQRSVPIPIRSGAHVVLSTVLEVPDGEGQVVMNGRIASAVRPGLAATAEGRRGANRVEAVLVRGAGRSGTWRFDFSGPAAFKPVSLRVVAGTVAMIADNAVVFRLQGKPGERIVFTFAVDD